LIWRGLENVCQPEHLSVLAIRCYGFILDGGLKGDMGWWVAMLARSNFYVRCHCWSVEKDRRFSRKAAMALGACYGGISSCNILVFGLV